MLSSADDHLLSTRIVSGTSSRDEASARPLPLYAVDINGGDESGVWDDG